MSEEKQLDEQGSVRKAWVVQYLAYACDHAGEDHLPDEVSEDISRHLSRLDLGADWTSEFIGDVVLKMAIMWDVGGGRVRARLAEALHARDEWKAHAESLDKGISDLATEIEEQARKKR